MMPDGVDFSFLLCCAVATTPGKDGSVRFSTGMAVVALESAGGVLGALQCIQLLWMHGDACICRLTTEQLCGSNNKKHALCTLALPARLC